jgi:hypothetical protein
MEGAGERGGRGGSGGEGGERGERREREGVRGGVDYLAFLPHSSTI